VKAILVILGIILALVFSVDLEKTPEQVAAPSATPIPQQLKTVETSGQEFAYGIIETRKKVITLIANYGKKRSSEEFMKEYSCTMGINGGFYGQDNQPLGWLVSNGETLSKKRDSELFNGFLFSSGGGYKIEKDIVEEVENGIQSGPILWWQKNEQALNIREDKQARRSVALIDTKGNLIFLVIYDPLSVLDGPKLAELPRALAQIANAEGWTIEKAINLDGGTASAFHSPTLNLSEWQTVGSWWCVK